MKESLRLHSLNSQMTIVYFLFIWDSCVCFLGIVLLLLNSCFVCLVIFMDERCIFKALIGKLDNMEI